MTSRELAEKIYAFMSESLNGLGSWDINPFTGVISREVQWHNLERHGVLVLEWIPEVPLLEAWINQTMQKFVTGAGGTRMHTESNNNFALGHENVRIKLRMSAANDTLYFYRVPEAA